MILRQKKTCSAFDECSLRMAWGFTFSGFVINSGKPSQRKPGRKEIQHNDIGIKREINILILE